MASPVVAGTVALMIQANPTLTPNLVKAILQYTAQRYNYDALTQGAGFLNAQGAVELARFFEPAQAGDRYPELVGLEQADHLGQPPPQGRRDQAERQRLEARTSSGARSRRDGENIVWGTPVR